MLALPSHDTRPFQQMVTYEGLEQYQAAVARKRGVLFLTAHLEHGNSGPLPTP